MYNYNPYLNNYYNGMNGMNQNQNNYNQQYIPNQSQNIQSPMTIYTPLTFVNGIEGAKKFIVPVNSTVYLRDSDSDKIYIKTCDSQGRPSLETYKLTKLNENGEENIQEKTEYLKMSDFLPFKEELEKTIQIVSQLASNKEISKNEPISTISTTNV